MKSKIIFLIVLIIIATVFQVSANSSPCVLVNDVCAKAGGTVEVTVSLDSEVDFSNVGIEIGYDSNAFTLVKVTAEDFGATCIEAQTYSKNPYNITWNSSDSTRAHDILAVFTFEVSKDAKNMVYPITVEYYKGRNGNYIDGEDVNYDAAEKPLNLSYQNGSITVKSEKDRMFVTDISFENGVSFSVDVTSSERGGYVLAVLYDSKGAVASKKICTANEVSAFSFTEKGSLIKIMWWDFENMIPISKYEEIKL